MTPSEFVKKSNRRGEPIYLPPPIRDFHDQKELFKDIQRFVENKQRADKNYTYLDGMTWVKAHVYVIDFFLWFMAQHGYTLQKCRRKDVEFHDLETELAAHKDLRFKEYLEAEAKQ